MLANNLIVPLIVSFVSCHCNQIAPTRSIQYEGGRKPQRSSRDNFSNLGYSSARFAAPLGDWPAPERFVGMNEPEMYAQMLKEGKSVRDLFNEIADKEVVKFKYESPTYGGYEKNTCGYYDPKQKVILSEDNPQTTSTGNNHGGPAEVWIDDIRTSHISNLMGAQPEVLDRSKYNCAKDYCNYRWYWLAFRADQKSAALGPTVQMWVQCAMIKGNGETPIPVRPTGKWLKDPREKGTENDNVPINKLGHPVTPNDSEIRVT